MMMLMSCFVFAGPGRTTYQARIVKPDGYPLESVSVNFRFTILDPSASCVLYIEDYAAVDMTGTRGLISFALGMGTKTYPTSGTVTFEKAFDNSVPSLACQSPGIYNPMPDHNRSIVMQFNDGNGWQTLPAMAINAVPYSMFATKAQNSEKLNGKADTNFVEYATLASLNCQANEAIKFNGVSFSCIAVGAASSGITSVTTSGSVLTTGGTASAPVISIQMATGAQSGYLSSSDWTVFNNKQNATSGAIIATLGYTPADTAALSALSSTVSSLQSATTASSTLLTNNINSVSSAVASLQAATAASLTAITSSQWVTSGTSIFYNTGRVGIGVSDPTADLDVAGALGAFRLTRSTANGTAPDIYLQKNKAGSGTVVVGDGTGHISFGGDTGAASYTRTARISSFVTSAPAVGLIGGDMRFYTNNGGADATSERMRITDVGNIGFGVVAPSAKLHLAAGTSTNAPLKFNPGTLLSSPQSGTVEYDGSDYYFTDSANVRRSLSSIAAGGVTSSAIASALGYTPANSSTVTSLSSTVAASFATTVASLTTVTNNINSVSSAVSSLTTSTAASFAAISSSQWVTSGTTVFYNTGNVGIGTSTPTALLNIKGGANSGIAIDASSSNTYLDFRAAGIKKANIYWDATNSRFSINDVNAGPTIMNAAGGNVGIGITNPSYQLDVSGTFRLNGGEAATGNGVTSYIYGQDGANDGGNRWGGNIYITPGARTGTGTSGGVIIGDAGLSSANAWPLVVYGNNSSNAKTGVNLRVFDSSPFAADVGGGISFWGNIAAGTSTFLGEVRAGKHTATSGDGSGYLAFLTNGGTQEKMRITSSGAVGIGITTPGSKLVVKGSGTTSATSALNVTDSSNNSAFYISDDGNIGVNTIAPTGVVDIKGSGQAGPNNSSMYNLLRLGNASALDFGEYAGGQLWMQASTRSNYATKPGLIINPDGGNIGIGTTSLAATLDISGTLNVKNSSVNTGMADLSVTGNAANLNLRIYNSNAGVTLTDGTNLNNAAALYAPTASKMVFVGGPVQFAPSSGTTAFRIETNGNVGVGVTTPTAKLDVSGTVKATAFQGNGSALTGVVATPAGANKQIQFNNSGSMGGSASLVWDNTNTRLGVGTASTTARLHVYQDSVTEPAVIIEGPGAISPTLYWYRTNTTADAKYWRARTNSNTDWFLETVDDTISNPVVGIQVKRSANTVTGVAFPNGNVGVGTSSPTRRLSVSNTNATTYASNGTAPSAAVSLLLENPSTTSASTFIDMTVNGGNGAGRAFIGALYSGWAVANPPPNIVFGTTKSIYTEQMALSGMHGTLSVGYPASSLGGMTPLNSVLVSGSVGIGTVTPAKSLTVVGSMAIGSAANSATRGVDYLSIITSNTGNRRTGIQLSRNATGLFELGTDVSMDNSQNFYIYDNIANTARVIIDGSGNFGIGATPTSYKLDVNGEIVARNGYGNILYFGGDSGGNDLEIGTTQAGNNLISFYNRAAATYMDITARNITYTGSLSPSDRRLKKDIQILDHSLDKMLKVEGVSYNWKDPKKYSNGLQYGVIAQQVEEIFPNLVDTNAEGMKKVNYMGFISPLIESLKEFYSRWMNDSEKLHRDIASLEERKADKAEIEKLKNENAELRAYLCAKDPAAPICK